MFNAQSYYHNIYFRTDPFFIMSVATNGRPFIQYLDSAVQTPPNGFVPVRSEDAKLIREFIEDRISERGITPHTAKVIASYLIMFSRKCSVPFRELDDRELKSIWAAIRADLKKNTLRRMIPVLKSFIIWLINEGVNTTIDKEKVQAIKAPQRQKETKKPGQMLTADELIKLIQAAKNPRDKAMIALMFESACRPIEICRAVWEDLVFDKYGAQFTAYSKTDKSRYVRLIFSAPHLIAWSESYPGNPSGNNPIFPSLKIKKLQPITQSGLKSVIYTAAKDAGIQKKVHPYLLRHSRITSMVADEIPESVIKAQCWGSLDSRMLSTYTHLKNSDVDRILLTRAGIEISGKKESEFKPVQCLTCGTVNPIGAKFCMQCRSALTDDAREETAILRQQGTTHPLLRQEFRKMGMSETAIDLLLAQLPKI